MKTIYATAMIMLISIITLSAQKEYSKEEQTIIGILQQHYDHWKNRDYEKWTELWVHEDYVGYTRTMPDNFVDRKGWEEISAAQRNAMKNNSNPSPVVDFSQFDYTFVIRDNMAIVKFIGDSDQLTTSVFEKVNGTWKYILNEQVNKTMFDLGSDIRKLGSFEGKWQLIPGSFKWQDSDNKGEILRYPISITQTLKGIDINIKFNYRNAQQTIWRGTINIAVIKNSPSGKLIHTMSTYYSNNGWTNNSTGNCEITDQTIELNGAIIGNEKNTYSLVIKKDSGDQINVSFTDGSGEKWSVEMKLLE